MKLATQFMVATSALLMVTGNAGAQQFLAYEGRPLVKIGEGGTRKTVDGVDFWQSGEPPHRYQVVGTIDDSRHETGLFGMVRMSQLDHDIARLVRQAGADGVVLAGEGENVIGLSSFANASANGTYGGGTWSASGSSFGITRQMKSHQAHYVVVKYLPDFDAPAASGAGPWPNLPPSAAIAASR